MSSTITVRRSAAALLLAGLALTARPVIAQPASLVGRWDGVVVVNGLSMVASQSSLLYWTMFSWQFLMMQYLACLGTKPEVVTQV